MFAIHFVSKEVCLLDSIHSNRYWSTTTTKYFINILIWHLSLLIFGAKRPRGYPKGGMDPSGSSDNRKMEARSPLPPGGQRAAESCEYQKTILYQCIAHIQWRYKTIKLRHFLKHFSNITMVSASFYQLSGLILNSRGNSKHIFF